MTELETALKLAENIAACLRARGVENVSAEIQPVRVCIQRDQNWEWNFGAENETWSGDLCCDHDPQRSVELPFPDSHDSDGKDIAEAILKAIADKPITTEELAREFCAVLGQWLKPFVIEEIARRNAGEKEKSICHSHDFCDSNQAMIDAYQNLTGTVPDVTSEAFDAIAVPAWDMAKQWGFKVPAASATRTPMGQVSIVDKPVPSGDSDGFYHVDIGDRDSLVAVVWGGDEAETQARAEFIVAACNAFKK